MKYGSFTIILSEKDFGKTEWTTFNHPKSQSSSKEGHALCLVGLERDPVLWAFTKQRDDKFREVLFPIRRNEDWTAIEQKRPEIANRKGIVFHQDNARPHVSLITRQKLLELGWDVLPHPYSPDLASSDFHLFRSLQNSFNGKSFNSLVEVKNHLESFSLKNLRDSGRMKFSSCLKDGERL